ncbi:MAG: DMT family transporter [Candidatus Binatus sp.]|uniref:DMT family transporter n=1 Tax=Candidatus Binatus sp. TaxID=2811406 RepID=UPI002719B5EB|nr:DMT family transporter [Candidatus Binatus sp.]MDO8432954.1 DMT family transporter [Candidatus Binatus sp.]
MKSETAAPLGVSGSPADSIRERAFKVGLTLAIISTILGAGQPVITRWGAIHLDPLLFCTGAVVFATLCILPVLYLRGELPNLVDRRFRGRLAQMSLSGTVATSLTLTYGLTQIGAVAGVLLMQSEPIYSLVLATIFVGERASIRQILATTLILAGIGSVFEAGGAFSPLWAAALVFVTPLFWQISHIVGLTLMPPLTPPCVVGGRFLYASIFLSALLLIFRPASLAQLSDLNAVGVIAITGFFIYFLSALSWYGAISRLSLAWTTALVVPGVPLLSILFAVLFLGEHATTREAIGILIAVGGVIALVLGADAHRKLPNAAVIEAVHEPLI